MEKNRVICLVTGANRGIGLETVRQLALLGHTVILVNTACPGWVRKDMGGRSAPRSVEAGAKSIIWAATLPDNGPSGGFFRDGNPLPW